MIIKVNAKKYRKVWTNGQNAVKMYMQKLNSARKIKRK